MLQSGASIDDGEQVKEINASDIVDLFQLVLDSPYANTLIRQWTLMALAKLAIRFAEAGTPSASVQQERITEILAGYSEATELEIQQRAVEFGQLFTKADVIGGVLEHMPAPELKATIMGTGELLVLFAKVTCCALIIASLQFLRNAKSAQPGSTRTRLWT